MRSHAVLRGVVNVMQSGADPMLAQFGALHQHSDCCMSIPCIRVVTSKPSNRITCPNHANDQSESCQLQKKVKETKHD